MTGPTITLAEAVTATGLSASTLRRRRGDLVELGATHSKSGWRIPITALVALDLLPAVTPPDTPPGDTVAGAVTPPDDVEVVALRAEVVALRQRLVDAEQARAVAEAVATERDRVIEAQRQHLRMIEAPAEAVPEPVPIRVLPEPTTARRRWFLRWAA
ncbi:MAG: hypothetical protein FWG25_02700 [Promicromonosporaceae bacterium]|nr:hypothetical protein [Promicromonosporaceae bacterium]